MNSTTEGKIEELNMYIYDLQKGINEIMIVEEIKSLDELKEVFQDFKSLFYIINDEDINDSLDDLIQEENIKSIDDVKNFLKKTWIWKQEISIELNNSFTESRKIHNQIRYGHFLCIQVDLESNFDDVYNKIHSNIQNTWLEQFNKFVNVLEILTYSKQTKNTKQVEKQFLDDFQKTYSKKPTINNIKKTYKEIIGYSYLLLLQLLECEILRNIIEEEIINYLIENKINKNTDFECYLSDLTSIFDEIEKERYEYKDDYEDEDSGELRVRIERDQLKPLIKYYVPDFDTEQEYSVDELFNIVFKNKIGYQQILDFQQRQG